MTAKQAVNGKFSKPKGCFSQISNKVLHDPTLSLKAKGLYALIVSYITLPNFTLYKGFLQSLCSEGRHAFDSAWKELVAAGYLSHTRTRQQDGTFAYEYSLEEKKVENASPTFEIEKQPKIDKSEKRASLHKTNQKLADDEKSNSSCSTFLSDSFTKEKEPITENQSPVSYIYNKTITNNNQSMEKKEQLKQQIDYDYFMEEPYFSTQQKIIVSYLLDYLVELEQLQTAETQQLLQMVDSCFISEFLEHIQQASHQPIQYPIPYWRKAFQNYVVEFAFCLTTIQG